MFVPSTTFQATASGGNGGDAFAGGRAGEGGRAELGKIEVVDAAGACSWRSV